MSYPSRREPTVSATELQRALFELKVALIALYLEAPKPVIDDVMDRFKRVSDIVDEQERRRTIMEGHERLNTQA